MKIKLGAVFLVIALSAAGDVQAPTQAYGSGFSVALKLGSELYEALPPKFGDQLDPQPIALQTQDVPVITPITSMDENKTLRQVSLSAGMIDLLNHIAHAKAIDHIQPGYFQQYVLNFERLTGDGFTVQPPNMVDPRYWTDDVINDQLGYFNQMVGLLVAINLSHQYLGHYNKYSAKMLGAGNKTIPINDFLTPAEWEVSVKAGTLNALNCALATEGAKALFEALDKMPRRPAWADSFVPGFADMKKLNKELSNYETEFFHGRL